MHEICLILVVDNPILSATLELFNANTKSSSLVIPAKQFEHKHTVSFVRMLGIFVPDKLLVLNDDNVVGKFNVVRFGNP